MNRPIPRSIMALFEFSRFDGSQEFSPQSADRLFDQLAEHLLDHGEHALDGLERLEDEHPDLIDMLVRRGYVEKDAEGKYRVTPRGIRRVESKALEELFGVSRRDKPGAHETDLRGAGTTMHDESRPYRYGDPVSNLDMHETLRNAIRRTSDESRVTSGKGVTSDESRVTSRAAGRDRASSPRIRIAEEDLVVHETEYSTSCATVVLLDMSGSMMRYGKFGQAKRVALALSSLVRGRYPGDFLQVVGFHTYATPLSERELVHSAPKPVSIFDSRVNLRIDLDRPPRFVPEHFTNIQAGLQFARRILKRRPAQNKQIITITDGEPTAHVEGREVVLIYPPSEKTARVTLAEARRCANEGLHLASFALVEDYFYLGLVNFVERMAAVSGGVAAYCDADDLGNIVIDSFVGGRRKRRAM
ncbi:MAG: VWA domain-containing protein [Planctomycetaceae bacterium]